jgi:hypothetical protein
MEKHSATESWTYLDGPTRFKLKTGTLILGHGAGNAAFGSQISRSTDGGRAGVLLRFPKTLFPDTSLTLSESATVPLNCRMAL